MSGNGWTGHPAPVPNPELAKFIAAEPGSAEWLLRVHVDDGTGKCRGCPNGSHGRLLWPCSTQVAATWVRGREARANLRWSREQ